MVERENLLTEQDGDDGDDLSQGGAVHQGGQEGDTEGLSPVRTPLIRQNDERQASEEFEVVEVDDNGKPLPGQRHQEADLPGGREERLTEGEGADGTLLEQRQARGRTPAERRRIQREGRERTQRENAALRRQVEDLTARVDGFVPRFQQFDAAARNGQLQRFDNEIAQQGSILREAQTKQADAIRRMSLGEDVDRATADFTAAQNAAYQAVAKGQSLTNEKAQFERETRQGNATGGDQPVEQRQQRTEQPVHDARTRAPRALSLGQEFLARHDWIDVNGGDPVSRLALDIDEQVLKDGFDPRSPEYWEEYEDRLAEVLPDRFRQNGRGTVNGNGRDVVAQNGNGNGNGRQPPARRQQQAPQRRGPMVGGSEGRAPASGKTVVMLSSGRKQGLIDAGVIATDGKVIDKKKFENMKRQFAEFDRQNG